MVFYRQVRKLRSLQTRRADHTVRMNFNRVHPPLLEWAGHYSHLREVTAADVTAATGPLHGSLRRQTLTCGADPLHLAAVFGIDDTTAIKYAAIARQLQQTAAGQHHPSRSREPKDQNRP